MVFVYYKMYKYVRGKSFKYQVHVKCKCFHLKQSIKKKKIDLQAYLVNTYA